MTAEPVGTLRADEDRHRRRRIEHDAPARGRDRGGRASRRSTRTGRRSASVRRSSSHGWIPDAKLAEAADCARQFASQARALRCGDLRVVVTAPGRQSVNADDLVIELQRATGAVPRVLSAEDEGRYAYLGAAATLPGAPATLAVCDVGGGSTEVAVGPSDGSPEWLASVDIGSLRLTSRMLEGDAPGKGRVKARGPRSAELFAGLDAAARRHRPGGGRQRPRAAADRRAAAQREGARRGGRPSGRSAPRSRWPRRTASATGGPRRCWPAPSSWRRRRASSAGRSRSRARGCARGSPPRRSPSGWPRALRAGGRRARRARLRPGTAAVCERRRQADARHSAAAAGTPAARACRVEQPGAALASLGVGRRPARSITSPCVQMATRAPASSASSSRTPRSAAPSAEPVVHRRIVRTATASGSHRLRCSAGRGWRRSARCGTAPAGRSAPSPGAGPCRRAAAARSSRSHDCAVARRPCGRRRPAAAHGQARLPLRLRRAPGCRGTLRGAAARRAAWRATSRPGGEGRARVSGGDGELAQPLLGDGGVLVVAEHVLQPLRMLDERRALPAAGHRQLGRVACALDPDASSCSSVVVRVGAEPATRLAAAPELARRRSPAA